MPLVAVEYEDVWPKTGAFLVAQRLRFILPMTPFLKTGFDECFLWFTYIQRLSKTLMHPKLHGKKALIGLKKKGGFQELLLTHGLQICAFSGSLIGW